MPDFVNDNVALPEPKNEQTVPLGKEARFIRGQDYNALRDAALSLRTARTADVAAQATKNSQLDTALASETSARVSGDAGAHAYIDTKLAGIGAGEANAARITAQETHTSGWVNVKSYGAACDGVTDDYADLAAMVTALGSTAATLIVPGPCLVGTDLTIPSNLPVRFEGAGAFIGAGTVTFTGGPLVTATGAPEAKPLSTQLSELMARVQALESASVAPSAVVTNLSGDLTNATDWLTPDPAVTLTRLTPAQFLAEQPAAIIPAGHVAANGILKIAITAPGGAYRVRGRNFTSRAYADLHNITHRFYMPPSMASRFASITTGNTIQLYYPADAYSTLTNYFSKTINYRPSVTSIGAQPGNFHTVVVPSVAAANAVGTLARTLSHVSAALVGTPAAGNWTWSEIDIRGDAAATSGDPLVLYLIDIVEIVESTPTLYFRWDDGADEHRSVSEHMRKGARFDGGRLARPLPSTFCIIDQIVGTTGYLTAQDLRAMAAEGSTFSIHGISGSWSAYTDAQITGEVEAFRSRVGAEGWRSAFKKALTFPGNDNFDSTLSGTHLATLAKSLGATFNTGHSSFGYGFSFGALGDPMNTAAVLTLGQSSATAAGSAADAETILSFMNTSKLSLVLMGHGVTASPGSIDLTPDQFDAMMTVFADEAVKAAPRVRVADLIADAVRAGALTN
jgi:hypothetical protein